MPNAKRQARDAVVGLLIALAPFAYKQFTLGYKHVAGLTAVVMLALILIYRYADAKVIEAAGEIADADELKPVLRRVGRSLRRHIKRD